MISKLIYFHPQLHEIQQITNDHSIEEMFSVATFGMSIFWKPTVTPSAALLPRGLVNEGGRTCCITFIQCLLKNQI